MTSLVVPGMGVTIARASSSKALNMDDFPTFGRPTMATLIPSLKTLPTLQRDINLLRFVEI